MIVARLWQAEFQQYLANVGLNGLRAHGEEV